MKVFNVVLVTDVRPLICGSVVVVFLPICSFTFASVIIFIKSEN